jgi:hypothetical protein
MSTETVKKTKAPAKPKTAAKTQAHASAVKAAPAAKVVKAAAKTKTVDVAATSAPSYEEIAQLAQRYWAERGYRDGQAEQDWLRAEQELAGAAS